MEPSASVSRLKDAATFINAAVYLRESTDEQRYSSKDQMAVISAYALAHRMHIVRVYQDTGRSGITLRLRKEFQRLLWDVLSGVPGFSVLLVHDVSRWGRFQDIDESSHLEFLFRRSGIGIHYCAEQFNNDGGFVSSVLKGLKRTMAAEYSRELSAKTSRGHERLATYGFHQGGSVGFGLRRLLVDRDGNPRELMLSGQRKHFADDRVIVVPGPVEETRVVQSVFKKFVGGESASELAKELNRRGFKNTSGHRRNEQSVCVLLRNEKYIGNLVYNQTNAKLQAKRVINPRSQWIRAEGTLARIVEQQLFDQAQAKLRIGRVFSDVDMLNHLTAVWCISGHLSAPCMRANLTCPSPSTIGRRFGGLPAAYRLLGYRPTHRFRYVEICERLVLVNRKLIGHFVGVKDNGAEVLTYETDTELLRLPDGRAITLVVIPYTENRGWKPGWWIEQRTLKQSDMILIARLRKSNTGILDLHLLPSDLFARPAVRFSNEMLSALGPYRLGGPDDLLSVLRNGFHYEGRESCP